MKKPLIGVIPLYDEERTSYWMLPGYMKGIEEAGGIPVMLPLTTDSEVISKLAETFDGFLFTGGQDVDPALYGEEKKALCGAACAERDKLETELFRQVVELDKPAFGICRGIQMMNVALGGTLYQDIPSEMTTELQHSQKPPYDVPVHSVIIEPGTLLHHIVQADTLRVNSYHHQGIKRLSDQLIPVAQAEDGLIEGVVLPGRRFILGVQWHPEYMYESDTYSLRLFQAFVQACS
jgi:putative glutamine amidotransferase